MANEYMDQWNVNGDLWDIHDKGRGLPNGVATLDGNGRIPYSQLPESAMEFQGYWNASTNTPTLADGTGTKGDFYVTDTAGTQDLGSGDQYFAIGDRVLYDGSVWKNIDRGVVHSVSEIAPDNTGAVDLTKQTDLRKLLNVDIIVKLVGNRTVCNWKQGTGSNTSYTMQYLVYANGLWVCGSNGGGVWWSEDGKSWTQGTGSNTSFTTQCLGYADGIWVCGSDYQGMWWSNDGKSWTQGTGSPISHARKYLVYANGLWVCGSNGMWWSEDGKSWTQGTGANTSYTMQYLVYANGLWVCGSNSYGIWWSEDGKSWTQGTGSNTTQTMQYLVYANGLCVCGSSGKGMWWSSDGKSWTQGTGSNTSQTMQYLVYANGLWVCGSSSKGMWYGDYDWLFE